MRPFIGVAFIASFVLWTAYRIYKKDLKAHIETFYVFLAFNIAWLALYLLIWLV